MYAGPRAVSARVAGGIAGSPLAPSHLNGHARQRSVPRTSGGASSASITTAIAPVRSSVAPVRIRRIILCGPRIALQLPARVEARDAHAQVAILGITKTSLLYHAQERLLIGKLPNGFDEVLIAVAIPGDSLAHAGNDIKAVEVIDFLHHVVRDLAKFQHHQASAGSKHAIGLVQRLLRARHISNAKADGVDVK